MPNEAESWDFAKGALETGEPVGVHETAQPEGAVPNPTHSIGHTEFICVREGVLEFTHDGRSERAEAGSVIYVAKGTVHQVKNVGEGKAVYFVVAVGGDVA